MVEYQLQTFSFVGYLIMIMVYLGRVEKVLSDGDSVMDNAPQVHNNQSTNLCTLTKEPLFLQSNVSFYWDRYDAQQYCAIASRSSFSIPMKDNELDDDNDGSERKAWCRRGS